MYSITSESPAHPDIIALIAELDRYQSALYPAESNHLLDLTGLPEHTLIMMVIRDRQLNAVGCGAVVLNADGSGEMNVSILTRHIAGSGSAKNCWRRWKMKPSAAAVIPCAWRPASASQRRCGYMNAAGIRPARHFLPTWKIP